MQVQTAVRNNPMRLSVVVLGLEVKGNGEIYGLKEETHAARWGLLRGYSGKATKWVDFVCDRLNPKGVLPLV